MKKLNSVVLTGSHVILEPLQETHYDELYHIAQDEKIWAFHASSGIGTHFRIWFDKALTHYQQHEQLPFVVRCKADNKIIGSTRYYDIALKHRQLSIGNTWYTPAVWGSPVNTECKYLLLQHAFEALHMLRVQFKTDARNLRSRAAIKKLGATEEGILRCHMILDNGFIRDSVVFSIIYSEWDNVKKLLQERIRLVSSSN